MKRLPYWMRLARHLERGLDVAGAVLIGAFLTWLLCWVVFNPVH